MGKEICCRLLVSGGLDATVSLFELQTLTCLRTFSKFDHPARGVSFSADSNYIAYFAEGALGVSIDKSFTGDLLQEANKPQIATRVTSTLSYMIFSTRHRVTGSSCALMCAC